MTLVFPAEEDETEILEIAKSVHNFDTQEGDGQTWHCARFTREEAEELKRINDLLAERKVFALFNGRRVPFGRSMWLPLMYIFTAGKVE